jgi:hypothetical protein
MEDHHMSRSGLRIALALTAALVPALVSSAERKPVPAGGGYPWNGRPDRPGPLVVEPVRHDLSPPLTEIARTVEVVPIDKEIEVEEGVTNNEEAGLQAVPVQDPVLQTWTNNLIPGPEFSFEGNRNSENASGVSPPDTNGDIGPNHYVQTVNLIFSIYNRAGNRLLGPLPNNVLWAGFGGDCQTRNNGDPIVLYDHMADRWLLSQFTTAAPFHQCIAISQTPDPTGTWFRYDYIIPSGIFNDYPKFGVWPDGYYMSAGSRGIPGPTTDVFAFERPLMLVGGVARMVTFTTPSALGYVAPMPADLDGPLPPVGAPNTFVGVKQSVPQALYLFQFHVDWTNPANSTFGLSGMPNDTLSSIAPFTLICPSTRNCIQQPPPTTIGLDALTGRYVMYRAQYRNFGTHESIVFNHTVEAGGPQIAGVRWYEVRNPTASPTIFQQGTYAPADGVSRWMGSAAMDRNGNFAVGYSVASPTVFPGIRYAGRVPSDPPGTLGQGEATLIAGSGSQTSTGSRWGDYSMLAVDPVDDCTFWCTTEYYTTTSSTGWQTRIGRFRFPDCVVPDFAVTASPNTVTVASGGSTSTTISVQSINGFSSLVNLSCLSAATAGLACSFSPGGVTPLPNQSAPSTLTFNVDASVRPGTYFVLVEGRSGGTVRSARVGVTVTP